VKAEGSDTISNTESAGGASPGRAGVVWESFRDKQESCAPSKEKNPEYKMTTNMHLTIWCQDSYYNLQPWAGLQGEMKWSAELRAQKP
jgi:hypothetical protein